MRRLIIGRRSLDGILSGFTKTQKQLREFIEDSEGYQEELKERISDLLVEKDLVGRQTGKAKHVLSRLLEITGQ